MRRSAIASALVVAASLLAPPASGDVPVSRRFGGGPLSRSVQNEANAAIDAASAWIAARQDANGAWGGGDVRLTSLCAIALFSAEDPLSGSLPPFHWNLRRATLWLQSPEATNALAALEGDRQLSARAWREMALCAVTRGEAPMDRALLRPLPATNAPLPRALFVEWPVAEARRFRGIPTARPASSNGCPVVRFISDAQCRLIPPGDRGKISDGLSKALTDPGAGADWTGNAEAAWWLARMINRALGGELKLEAGEGKAIRRLTWRENMAWRWITTQRVDSSGKGRWGDESPGTTVFAVLRRLPIGQTQCGIDESLETTVFAVLLLGEL